MTFLSKLILSLSILCCACGPACGQFAPEYPDRLDAGGVSGRDMGFGMSGMVAPAVLLSSGVLLHCFAHESFDNYVRERALAWRGGGREVFIDDYLQYVPFAFAVGLGVLGVRSEHNLAGRALVFAFSGASIVVLTQTVKSLVNSPRPNGNDDRSFPSGHSGIAFAGAEFIRMEYGWGWGACAYAFAAGVGMMRVRNDEHWLSDVLAGAGMGILSARIGERLLEPAMKLLRSDVALSPALVDPPSGAVGINLAIKF